MATTDQTQQPSALPFPMFPAGAGINRLDEAASAMRAIGGFFDRPFPAYPTTAQTQAPAAPTPATLPAPAAAAVPAAAPAAAPDTSLTPPASYAAARLPTAPAAAARPRAAMPRSVVPNQSAQPLVPGETGFYVGWGNDKLVPYGTRIDGQGNILGGPGGGGGLYDGLPGGGKMVNGKFADPRDALEVGYRLQSQYRDESMQRILQLAGNGGDLGFHAKIAALAQAFGQNNFGATSVGGANALNSAIAGVTSSGLGAGATEYAADQSRIAREAEVGEQHYQASTGSIPTGTSIGIDPVTHMAVPITTYGQRPGQAGAMPMPYTQNKSAAPKEGATGTYRGKPVKFSNGSWQYTK